MKTIFTASLFFLSYLTFAQIWPASLKGRWTFENLSNLVEATVGNNLVLSGSHTSVAGPVANDNAVRIGSGSFYHCYHDIASNGAGSPQYVNKYTILIDFKVSQLGQWYTFFQTNYQNNNDGDAFINTNGQIGVSATGYSAYTLIPGDWYRLVITADLGNHFDYYLDGQLIQNGGAQVFDDRFALYPSSNGNDVLFFADDNGEDNAIDVAQIAIFETDLTSAEISLLGGYGHIINNSAIKPYLETPTPTSIYINWHNTNTSFTKVEFGTDSIMLNLSANGTNQNISGKRWHTVKLTGLNSNTDYFYRCISGTDISSVFPFHTAVLPNTPGGHIRFGIVGDSQTNFGQSSLTASAMREKFIELYGSDWYNKVNMIMHTGDIVGTGSNIALYETEYFNPFSILSCSVPFMISIGNHEGESSNFYNYMHYDDFSDNQYPNPLCEKYYSFTLGNVQFLAMNTAGYYDNTTQATWIQQKLDYSNTNTNIDFVFTYGHKPGRSEIWPDGNANYVYNTIYPIFSNYPKIAMHSFGHSHNYERGAYLSNNSEKRDFRTLLGGGAGGNLDRWGMYSNQIDLRDVQKSYDYYCYIIVDVDIDTKSYTATMYSLGNPDHPMYNVAVDSWHGFVNRPAPETPEALYPVVNCADNSPTLIASKFVGLDSIMSSQFQITAVPGNFNTTIVDTLRDWVNIYNDSGIPNFIPVDRNNGIDLRRLTVLQGVLQNGNMYEWRVRYRDQNCRWSEWSAASAFTIISNAVDSIDFIANITLGNAPLTVNFTDLSNVDATAWQWDVDNDGSFESSIQDAQWTYTNEGIYTVNLIVSYGGNIGNKLKTGYVVVGPNNVNTVFTENEIEIYPNPASTSSEIIIKGKDIKSVELISVQGNKINHIENGSNTNELKFYSISTGIYIVKISTANTVFVKKIIIQD